jgi:uncharacterized protein
LATADYNLYLLYRQQLAASKHPAELERLHNQWQRQLDKVDPNSDAIIDFYRRWFAELSNMNQQEKPTS